MLRCEECRYLSTEGRPVCINRKTISYTAHMDIPKEQRFLIDTHGSTIPVSLLSTDQFKSKICVYFMPKLKKVA